jgi:flagellar hook-associated protein 1 FlgK
MSISSLLNVSKDSMISYQLAMDITGGNISNVNTAGYSRQRAVFAATGNVNAKAASAQLSVKIETVERMFDGYTEMQIAEQSQKVGAGETKNSMLQRVETVFDETNGAKLNDVIGRFWSAWDDLAKRPAGQAERDALVSVAGEMTSMFNTYGDQLYSLQQNIDDNVKNTVAQINSYTADIASLNRQIGQTAGGGGETNRLLDERNALLKQLCGLVNCQYIGGPNNALNIYLVNGQALVEGETSHALGVIKGSDSEFYDVVYKEKAGESINQYLAATKGRLGALLDARDGIIPSYLDKIDDLAGTIMTQVNDIHARGFDAQRNLGGKFLVVEPEDSVAYARHLAVNQMIIADSGKIAASATVSGDGEQAAAIAALKDKLIMNGGQTTVSSFYASLIGQLGREVADAGRNAEYQANVMTQLANQREGISGVSIDEEMMNLIKYQMGYQAAGKLCQVVDEMMNTLMSLVK